MFLDLLAQLYGFYQFLRHLVMSDKQRRASIRASYLSIMADPTVSYADKQHLRRVVLPILEKERQ